MVCEVCPSVPGLCVETVFLGLPHYIWLLTVDKDQWFGGSGSLKVTGTVTIHERCRDNTVISNRANVKSHNVHTKDMVAAQWVSGNLHRPLITSGTRTTMLLQWRSKFMSCYVNSGCWIFKWNAGTSGWGLCCMVTLITMFVWTNRACWVKHADVVFQPSSR